MCVHACNCMRVSRCNGRYAGLDRRNFGLQSSTSFQRYLRSGAEESWFLGEDPFLAACEDARDSVGFGQQRAVDHGERESGHDAHHVASGRGRLGDDHEGHSVAQVDADQNDVAQLASGRLHHRSRIVPGNH